MNVEMTNRRSLIFAALLLIPFSIVNAQVLEPVTWSFKSEKTADSSYEIVMTAAIDDTWHLYAMDLPEGGPIATSFTFEPSQAYILEGKPVAVNEPEVKFDNSFGMDIGMHSGNTEFRQKITVKELPVTVTGYVTFMSCDDSQCLPPRDVEFTVAISDEDEASLQTAGASVSGAAAPAEQPKKGFLKFFLLSMLAGFAGILTPCVFPMIPMTVAFFSQGSGKKARLWARRSFSG